MKFLLISILINATSGAPIAAHQEGAFDTPAECGGAAQDKGIVLVHDNIATEYVCRQINEDGTPVEEMKVGPDNAPYAEWLKKQMERGGEVSQ